MNCPRCNFNLSPALLAIRGKPQEIVEIYDLKLRDSHGHVTQPVTIICVKRTALPKQPLTEAQAEQSK